MSLSQPTSRNLSLTRSGLILRKVHRRMCRGINRTRMEGRHGRSRSTQTVTRWWRCGATGRAHGCLCRNGRVHSAQYPEFRDPQRRGARYHRDERRNGAGRDRRELRQQPGGAGSLARGRGRSDRGASANPRGLARKLCSTAPATFTQHARNPARSVEIGGRNLVLAPVYGPPFVHDAAGGRRYATMADFEKFVKLGYMSKWLHHSGGTVCEPTDIAVNKRHLDMLKAHMTLSDKPFMGSVTEPSRAQDSVRLSEILFGEDFVANNAVMTSLININSPLTFDATMMGALEVYAEAGQACIVSPFIVGGAMAPVSVMGTLTQVLAEVMAGIAYSQLVRPGAPVIFGAFVTSIDMNSGAPTFGTPEASQITYGAGQLARRMGLPFRSAGSL